MSVLILKGRVPFVRLLVPLIAGILMCYVWPVGNMLKTGPVILILFLLLMTAVCIFYNKTGVYKRKWLAGCLIHAVIICIGAYLTLQANERLAGTHFSTQNGNGLVVSINNEPKQSGNILRFEAKVLQVVTGSRSRVVTGKLLVSVRTDPVEPVSIDYGQLFILPFRFAEVEPPYNPGEFNYKAYLADHQIYHQAFFSQGQITGMLHTHADPLIAFAIKLRRQLVNRFRRYVRDQQAASLASTLILGYKADLSREVINAYSKTGTLHVLSVSGMHVGIVFLVLAALLRPLDRTHYLRLLKACIIIVLIWFYALITGFSPSVCRAAVMLSFVVLGKAINRNQNTYNLIAVSAFILLVYNPYYLFDVGFQLSYLAVTGLVFLYPRIYHAVYCKYWLTDQIWSCCALSLAAQLATFPLSLYYFHQFPVYFLFSNLFIVLPVIVIMYAGIALLFIPWPFILEPLGELLNGTINLTNASLLYMEKLPFASVNGIWIMPYQCWLVYIVIGCLLWAVLLRQGKALIISLGFVFILSCSLAYNFLKNCSRNEIVFYSLKTHPAIAHIKSNKAVILTGLPEKAGTFSFSVEPYLFKAGVSIQKQVYFKRNAKNAAKRNFVRFGHYRILVWDKSFDKQVFTCPVSVDAVLLSGNPNLNLKDLNNYVNYKELIIDATNTSYRISRWKQQVQEMHIKHYILKKNPAYIINL